MKLLWKTPQRNGDSGNRSLRSTSSSSYTFSPEAATDVALECKSETRNANREPLLLPILHPCSSSDQTCQVKPAFVFEELLITRFNTFACVSGLANTQQQRVQFKSLYRYKAIYKNIPGDVFSGIKSPPSIFFFQLTQTLLSQIDVKRLDNAHL